MLWDYLLSHKKGIFFWALCCAVFVTVILLYGLPAAPVIYAGLICGFFGAVFLGIDFVGYCKKRGLLRRISEQIAVSADNLPAPKNDIEREYVRLIKVLSEELFAEKTKSLDRIKDLTDYYTLWVHQIKTPISAMRLILQERDSEEYAELCENLQKIEQYAEMALCYIRLDSDSTDFVIREYDLDEILRQAARRFSAQFIRRKIRLDYEPIGKTVLTDEKWLLFIIEQVISNALKYTTKGSVSIYCESPLTLCIRDTGIGIAKEDLPRVFEKGYTGINGRFDKKASGIGLYLCKKVCGKLGHTITAESGSDGTTIKIGLEHRHIGIE